MIRILSRKTIFLEPIDQSDSEKRSEIPSIVQAYDSLRHLDSERSMNLLSESEQDSIMRYDTTDMASLYEISNSPSKMLPICIHPSLMYERKIYISYQIFSKIQTIEQKHLEYRVYSIRVYQFRSKQEPVQIFEIIGPYPIIQISSSESG